MPLSLRPIDKTNVLDCFALRLGPGQEVFVSSPMRSLALSYAYRDTCLPLGLYDGETLVGYGMLLYTPEDRTYTLWHFMIDLPQQGKGYGRAALALLLERISQEPLGSVRQARLLVNPQNAPAIHLYRAFGFRETGYIENGENEMTVAAPFPATQKENPT